MADRLFYASFHHAIETIIGEATAEVQNLDRNVFVDEAKLQRHLQEIASRHRFEVAQLRPEGIKGKRREQERQVHDIWEGRGTIKQSYLDVTVPFAGEADSFRISPTRATIITQAVAIGPHSLTLSLWDNDNVQQELDSFLKYVGENLEVLRTDFGGGHVRLGQAIQQAAETRKRKILAEDERDKKLKFTVEK